jgi:TolB protein
MTFWQRNKHFVILGGIVGFALLGVLLIIFTSPSRPPAQTALPTATPDPSTSVQGANLGDGQLAFSHNGALWNWRGNTARKIPLDPGKSVIANANVRLLQPALSPDGKRIAFVRLDESFSDLWVADVDGKGATQLTANKGGGTPRSPNFTGRSLWAFNPVWSPDGAELAFLTDNGTDYLGLWATPATRYRVRSINRQLGAQSGGVTRSVWSPGGESLITAAYDNGKQQIFSVRASNGNATKITSATDGAYDPAISPDGKSIAFVARSGNGSQLWLMNTDGSNGVLLTETDSRMPVWSPDNKFIAFLGRKDSAFELFTFEIATRKLQQISNDLKLDGTGGISWSR